MEFCDLLSNFRVDYTNLGHKFEFPTLGVVFYNTLWFNFFKTIGLIDILFRFTFLWLPPKMEKKNVVSYNLKKAAL